MLQTMPWSANQALELLGRVLAAPSRSGATAHLACPAARRPSAAHRSPTEPSWQRKAVTTQRKVRAYHLSYCIDLSLFHRRQPRIIPRPSGGERPQGGTRKNLSKSRNDRRADPSRRNRDFVLAFVGKMWLRFHLLEFPSWDWHLLSLGKSAYLLLTPLLFISDRRLKPRLTIKSATRCDHLSALIERLVR